MKNLILKTMFVLSCFIFIPSVYAQERGVIVVSNDVDISKISQSDLQSIFLGKKTLWNDGKRIKIGLSTEDTAKLDGFLTDNIGKTKRRFKKYWLKKVFAGYGIAPKIFNNNEKAIQFAQEQENSITYITVNEDHSMEGVKIINIY